MEDLNQRVRACHENRFYCRQFWKGRTYCSLAMGLQDVPCQYLVRKEVDLGATGEESGNKPVRSYDCGAAVPVET